MNNTIKIGVVSTRRNVFSTEEAIKHKNIILENLKKTNVKIIDIDDINSEGLLYDSPDVKGVVEKMQNENVDGILFPHCNFGSEALVSKVAKELNKPVLIWGPRDDKPLDDGMRTRDTQCGLFATGKVLRRFNVPFSYIVNSSIDSKVFKKGFDTFVRVCAVVKAFRNLKILQIAPRPSDFWTMIYNEGELLEKFGIEVFPVTLQDVKNKTNIIKDKKEDKYTHYLNKITGSIDCSSISKEAVENMAALIVYIRDYCDSLNLTAASIQCWEDLQDVLGIMPCISNGILAEEGLPVVCETDIHGAISAIILQEAVLRNDPVFFADLTIRHPENDNAELLWHCGNFPLSLADNKADAKAGFHFIMPSKCPGTGEWELKDGNITICRFDGDHGEYSLLIGEGKKTDGPSTKGTYVWFEVNDWPKWEYRIVTGPYVHHCVGAYGNVAHILYESCKYIPGLNPDPIEPTEKEIIDYLIR